MGTLRMEAQYSTVGAPVVPGLFAEAAAISVRSAVKSR